MHRHAAQACPATSSAWTWAPSVLPCSTGNKSSIATAGISTVRSHTGHFECVCVSLCVRVSPQACFKFNSAVIRMTRTIAKEVLVCISHRHGRGLRSTHLSLLGKTRSVPTCTYVYPTVQSLCKRRSHHSDVVNVYLSKVVVGIVRVRSRVARLHCQ